MNFAVIDVETANEAMSSICQIGIAVFNESKLAATWSALVNPEAAFSPWNVRVHGIGSGDVLGARTWAQVHPCVEALLEGRLVASHTLFDRSALTAAVDVMVYSRSEYRRGSIHAARLAWRGPTFPATN